MATVVWLLGKKKYSRHEGVSSGAYSSLARTVIFRCRGGLNCIVLRLCSERDHPLSQYKCTENQRYFPIDGKKLKICPKHLPVCKTGKNRGLSPPWKPEGEFPRKNCVVLDRSRSLNCLPHIVYHMLTLSFFIFTYWLIVSRSWERYAMWFFLFGNACSTGRVFRWFDNICNGECVAICIDFLLFHLSMLNSKMIARNE